MLKVGDKAPVFTLQDRTGENVSLSDFEKIFSFTLSDDALESFCSITEDYLLNKTQRKFKTLEFYNVIKE